MKDFWAASRVEFIMACVKQCGNVNDLPEDTDGTFEYFLSPDEKSGAVVEWWPAVPNEQPEIVYTFGGVEC